MALIDSRSKMNCTESCGADARPRDYIWCYVDCGRPVGAGRNQKRYAIEECTQKCGESDLPCYIRCMGIPDLGWIANDNNTESCMARCSSMLSPGMDYADCAEGCVISTYLGGNITPSNATDQTAGTEPTINQTIASTPTALSTTAAEAGTPTLKGSTQSLTLQSVRHSSKQANASSTTECPTLIAGFTSSPTSTGPEISLATLHPTDGSPHANRAEKQLEVTYRFIVVTILSGLVTGLAWGML
ncbi:hypothetical protein GP486_000895 [Trichoglossum hirsutum]|uniref:Uncharacterized protein n=1 Tax=Trichoglossum hirsutum TaxID=265104 RepID=A0A9P8LI25_9PEZI|nr:hypothetical protein GP486_000895 [Trichoglossum hirsutum]